MTGYAVANALLLLLVLFAMGVALCRGTRRALASYVAQTVVLCAILLALAEALAFEGMLMRSGIALLLKAVLIPAIILIALKRAGDEPVPVEPVVGATTFLALAALEILACFCAVSFLAPLAYAELVPALGIALGLFLMGLTAIVVHRDVFRQILGYLLMEAGSHLVLALLAPAMPEFAEVCVTLASVLAVLVMCVFAVYIRRVANTLDTDQLHELKG